MLIILAIVILFVTLKLRKNVSKSKVFKVFFIITLASNLILLISIFIIGGWEGIGIGMIVAPINLLAFIGMLIVTFVLEKRRDTSVDVE